MMLSLVPRLEDVTYAREQFPKLTGAFDTLFDEHGMEVRGKPFELDWGRIREIERQGRLVWIVARSIQTRAPIGYSCSFWYRDLHFDEIIAADDMWFVRRPFRGRGVGESLKQRGHFELAKAGVCRIYELVREAYNHPVLMEKIGFEKWGSRYVKIIPPTGRGGSDAF
jgi:hypothetical protein